ncbi:MAG: hypothetical protein Q7T36_07570 [Fluviicoccus sp.]|uniref:hypothetical protein n=1 Tax=Fluviicoccus sp. TaxID=2003552 RepID=UPI00271DFC17|nr:hypothetical protein [Fluviicoccus sp.]MDO8330311.1 hypothetical protein [Fluviicoccus sp.]
MPLLRAQRWTRQEGLERWEVDFTKFMLVLACMAPLFILMAIRGVDLIPWEIYFPIFLGLAIVPNLFFLIRVVIAVKNGDTKKIRVDDFTDNREQLITYIFAMLLPLFQASVATVNDLYAGTCALLMVIYIFGHMELYYMNIFFSIAGYRIITVMPDVSSGAFSVPHVIITSKESIPRGVDIHPIRITNFLLFYK